MINDTTSEQIVNENGETEVWSGGNNNMVQEFKEYIEKIKNATQF